MAKFTVSALFKGIPKSGNYVTFVGHRDTREGFGFTMGGGMSGAIIDYNGENDRSFMQLLDKRFGSYGTARDEAERKASIEGVATRLSECLENAVEAPIGDLFNGFAYCEPAASKDETRYNLCALYAKNGRMVATDGHRLNYRDGGFPVLDREVLLPIYDVRLVIRCLLANFQLHGVKTYRYGLSKSGMAFFTESPTLTASIFVPFVDGQFPDYEQVIPTGDTTARIITTGAEWSKAMQRAPLDLTGKDGLRRLRIGQSQVWAEAKDGEQFAMPGTVENHPDRNSEIAPLICLADKYLAGAIDSDGELVIEYRDELSPLVFKQGPATGVVMPVRG